MSACPPPRRLVDGTMWRASVSWAYPIVVPCFGVRMDLMASVARVARAGVLQACVGALCAWMWMWMWMWICGRFA